MRVKFSRFENTRRVLSRLRFYGGGTFPKPLLDGAIVGGDLVKGPFSGILAVIFLLASGFCIWKFSSTPNASTLLLVAGIVCEY